MKTKIEWATDVWNPTTGCDKVSEGCRNCYAEGIAKRFWGERKFTDVECHTDRLDAPLHWKKPRRVFVNSMSDLFHKDVPFEFVDQVFATMAWMQEHTFMVLTKRADRMEEFFNEAGNPSRRHILPNVWLGVSVENQQAADDRIPLLLQTPVAVRFVSVEPMLSAVNVKPYLYGWHSDPRPVEKDPGIDWMICGGETGPNARPMRPDWARSLRDQCQGANVPFFFKSWGEFISRDQWINSGRGLSCIPEKAYFNDKPMGEQHIYRVGKKLAGRLLDGVEWNEYPEARK